MAEEQSVITAELMEQIEAAAVSAARDVISGRRIVDVEGPYGLGLTTLEVGNDDKCREPGPDEASAVVSRALSLPMIYCRFAISKRRIAAFQELGQPLNLKAAEDAAQAVASREEEFVYRGQADFRISGLLTADGRKSIKGRNWDSVDEASNETLVNTLAMIAPFGAAEKQALLEAPDLKARAETLVAITELTLAGNDRRSLQ